MSEATLPKIPREMPPDRGSAAKVSHEDNKAVDAVIAA
jgi:hypothetical protein